MAELCCTLTISVCLEMGNVPKQGDDDPLLVNPNVELCAGFISKLNVTLYNYTESVQLEGKLN